MQSAKVGCINRQTDLKQTSSTPLIKITFAHFSVCCVKRIVCIVGGGPASFYTAQQLLKVCMPHHIHTFSGNISSSIRFF
uniref:Uncharacterized protein n=1 Tax=Cyprinus carpio TaxID=7962 RepID=A0A8C1X6W1_CYPCA